MRKLTAVLLTLVMIFSCAFACAEEGTEASESMIGIISAMQNEVDLLLSKAEIDHVDTVGGVDFNVGRLCGHPAVIAKAGVGKVLAASGMTAMLNRYPVSKVIFTGVAGGVRDETKVMDDAAVSEQGEEHAFKGVIASGDQFIASETYVQKLQADFDALACEMEGAAIDLNKEDPRRAEIIGYINEGLLPVPYNKSYNLADYESLKTQAEENRRNRDAAPEEMSDDPSAEIAITVGDEKITADVLKDEIRLELIRSALECAGYGYEYDTVDPENIADRADTVAFDLELRAVVREQARKLGADVLTPEAEEAVEKEVQETWDRYTAIARSDNGMAFLPAGEYEPVEGNPEETLERYFASFGLTKDALRRIAAAEQTDTQVETVVIAGKGLKTRDEIIDYYTDWILERYDEMNPVRNNDVINRVIQELAGEGAFSAIAGDWYEDEIMMNISNTGRFVVGWNDGDWTGTLEAEQITNTEGEEITAYRMISDDPKANSWENPELVPDIYYPGKLTLTRDGTPVDTFFNAPIRIEDMAGEDLANYEPYTLIDNTGGEDGAAIFMLTLLRPARDVAVMQMYNQGFDDEGTFGYDGDTLEWWAAVDSRTQIVVKHMFEGDLPELSISFIAEDDTSYNFAVEISGGNGEMILTPLEPLNG